MMTIYRAISELEAHNESGVVCIIVHSQGSTPRHAGSKMIVYPDGRIQGTIGGGELESRVVSEALQSLQDGKSRLLEYNMTDPVRGDPGVCGGLVEVYMEPIMPRSSVVIVGAGHVGRAVAHLAQWLGFHVVVSDDRVDFCNPETIPDADQYLPCPLVELPEHLVISSRTFLVLTTRSVDIDVPGLPGLLETPAAYIGVIGSKRRWATTRQQLIQAGVSESKLNRVRSPMGLDLNAETPEEIAVSIMAEIIQIQRKNDGENGKKAPGN
jgi:xanthine dehydrogenase accessory factor